jgi:hypothetical protein
MTMDRLGAIANAVLYEGYVLWPYRKSAIKNQRRWTFGGVYPAVHAREHPDDPAVMQTECLLEGPAECSIEVRVRFLHVIERKIARDGASGLEWVDELVVDGDRHLAWEEATEREVVASGLQPGGLESPVRVEIAFPAGTVEEALFDSEGRRAGVAVREWRSLAGQVEVSATGLQPDIYRLTVRVLNASPFVEGGEREDALNVTFCSTHTILRARGAGFVSLTDPPEGLRAEANRCENTGTWPVLVGEDGERDTLLSSPIILPDYPEVARESPGDLFDATEIDQLLTLSILSMTDEEKEEMRASDPKTREILERTESLTPEDLSKLHGTVRELRLVREA